MSAIFGGLSVEPKIEEVDDACQMTLTARWPTGSSFTSGPVFLRPVSSGSIGILFPRKKPIGWPSSRGVEIVLDASKISVATSESLDFVSSKSHRLPVVFDTIPLDLRHNDRNYLVQCLENLKNAGAKTVDTPPLGSPKKQQSGDERNSSPSSPPSSPSSHGQPSTYTPVVNSTQQVIDSIASQLSSMKRRISAAQTLPVVKRQSMPQPQQPTNESFSFSVLAPRHPPANFTPKCPIVAAQPAPSTSRPQHASERKHQATVYEDENKTRFIIIQEMTMRDEIWHRATPVGQLHEIGCSANEILNRACEQLSSTQNKTS